MNVLFACDECLLQWRKQSFRWILSQKMYFLKMTYNRVKEVVCCCRLDVEVV